MTYGAITGFIPYAATYTDNATMQAISSSTLIPGALYFSEEGGAYQFSTSILDLGTNDLLMDDNLGTMREYVAPNISINTSTNIVSSIPFLFNIVLAGQGTYTVDSNGKIYIPAPNLTADYTNHVEITLISVPGLSGGTLDTSFYRYIDTENSQVVVQFTSSTMIGLSIQVGYYGFNVNLSSDFNLGSAPTAGDSGIYFPNLNQNAFETYTTDATVQALTSSDQNPGQVLYSEESGFYYFNPTIMSQTTESLIPDDIEGVYNPPKFPMVYINEYNGIPTLNTPFTEAGFFVAAGVATLTVGEATTTLQITDINSIIPIETTDIAFVTIDTDYPFYGPYTTAVTIDGSGNVIIEITIENTYIGIAKVNYRVLRVL